MRSFATISFSFAAAVILAQYVLPQMWLLPVSGFLFLLALLAIFLKISPFRRHRYLKKRLVLMAVAAMAGLLYFAGFTHWVHQPAAALCDKERPFTGTVCDYAAQSDGKVKVTLLLEDEGLHRVKAVLYGDDTLLDIEPGQSISGQAYWPGWSKFSM